MENNSKEEILKKHTGTDTSQVGSVYVGHALDAMQEYLDKGTVTLQDQIIKMSENYKSLTTEIVELRKQLTLIPVETEYPPVLKNVLTRDKSGAERVLQLVDYEGGNDVTGFTTTYAWEDEETGRAFDDITHWRPIPQINNK